jgi:hypothetical protein
MFRSLFFFVLAALSVFMATSASVPVLETKASVNLEKRTIGSHNFRCLPNRLKVQVSDDSFTLSCNSQFYTERGDEAVKVLPSLGSRGFHCSVNKVDRSQLVCSAPGPSRVDVSCWYNTVFKPELRGCLVQSS